MKSMADYLRNKCWITMQQVDSCHETLIPKVINNTSRKTKQLDISNKKQITGTALPIMHVAIDLQFVLKSMIFKKTLSNF